MKHRPWKKTTFQTTTLIAVALLLLILFVSIGYFFLLTTDQSPPVNESALAGLDINHELWESRRPASFEYVVQRDCECSARHRRPYAVFEQNSYRAARYASPLETDESTREAPPEPVWLDELFNLVERAAHEADKLDVRYDPAFGYPIYVSIDWGSGAARDNVTLTVRDFQVIEYSP